MNAVRFTFCISLTALLWAAGCSAPKPPADPLAGWKYLLHVGHSHFDKAVVDDYWDYIHKLPRNEGRLVDEYSIDEFEDRTGQHAVKIEIPLKGTFWEHVLIYGKDNKR